MHAVAHHFKIINDVLVFINTHILLRVSRTTFVIIKKIVRKFKRFVFIGIQMCGIGHPVAVDSLVVNEKTKRLILVALLLEPTQTQIGNDIGHIPIVLCATVGCDENGIVIISLTGKNLSMV